MTTEIINRAKFFDGVRGSPFAKKLTKGQVEGMEIILGEVERRAAISPPLTLIYSSNDFWKARLAYILATAFHETARTMQPITEMGSKKYLQSKKYWPYIGRGYVQLTWRDNYIKYQNRLIQSDLFPQNECMIAGNPDLAKRPHIAVWILYDGMLNAGFTKYKLSDFINEKQCDFRNARKIVNGLDRADLIAGYAKQFLADIQEATR